MSAMGSGTAKLADGDKGQEQTEEKPKCKPCCACPETRKARDACIMEKGQENCKELIEAHKECMKKLGFNI